MKTPDVAHTPAGGSPRREIPKIDDVVEVVRLPDQCDKRLKVGTRGEVTQIRGAMFYVRFGWGTAALNVTQILKR